MAVLFVVLYFIPSIVCLFTKRRQVATLLVNVLLGWTLVGWVWALGLAVVNTKAERLVNLEEQVRAERSRRASRR